MKKLKLYFLEVCHFLPIFYLGTIMTNTLLYLICIVPFAITYAVAFHFWKEEYLKQNNYEKRICKEGQSEMEKNS